MTLSEDKNIYYKKICNDASKYMTYYVEYISSKESVLQFNDSMYLVLNTF